MLTRKQVAAMIGYSVATLKKWALKPGMNGLPVHQGPSGRVRYMLSDVEAWIARYRREPSE